MTEFVETNDRIRLFWSLLQIEKACTDSTLVNQENLAFINEVDPQTLDPRHFLLFKQLVCLCKLWFQEEQTTINFNHIYESFGRLTPEKREDFINEDPATKSNAGVVNEIAKILKGTFDEVNPHLSDDLMTLIDVACATKGP